MAKEKKLRIYSNLSGFNIYYVIMQHYGARVPDNFVISEKITRQICVPLWYIGAANQCLKLKQRGLQR